jgi:hypothetical protein
MSNERFDTSTIRLKQTPTPIVQHDSFIPIPESIQANTDSNLTIAAEREIVRVDM